MKKALIVVLSLILVVTCSLCIGCKKKDNKTDSEPQQTQPTTNTPSEPATSSAPSEPSEPEADPILGTFKFYCMGNGGEFQLGDDYYGLKLTDEYQVLVVDENGTFTMTIQNNSGSSYSVDVTKGTWEKKTGEENVYVAVANTYNDVPLDASLEDRTMECTLNNGVLVLGDGFGTTLRKETAIKPIVGTFKLYTMGGNELGTDYYGLILTEDTYVLTINNDGTFVDNYTTHISTDIHTVATGMWLEKDAGNGVYTLIYMKENGEAIEQYTQDITLTGDSLTVDDHGFITVYHKAA